VAIDLVIEDDGVLVGELGLQINRDRRIAEVGFWVTQAARRTGVGSRLLLAAELLAIPIGDVDLFAITLAENASAIALLEARGWPEVETTTAHKRAFRWRPSRPHT